MKTILVTGDPICDHNYYKGRRFSAVSPERRGFRATCVGGGALLVKELISKVIETAQEAQPMTDAPAASRPVADDKAAPARQARGNWRVEFGLNEDFRTLPAAYHSFCIWEPQDGPEDKAGGKTPQFWRMLEPPLGYGPKEEAEVDGRRPTAYDCPAGACTPNPDIVVIDDAGLGFCKEENHKATLSAFCRRLDGDGKASEDSRPDWVVVKLTGPVSDNPLLQQVISRYADRLVVIVPAEDLRRQSFRLSKGLSWEATAEDLTAELNNNPRLAPLLNARHLIVPFQSDAAYWRDQSEKDARAMLVFDAKRAEGEWAESQGKGSAYGYLSCFTAAIVKALSFPVMPGSQPDLETAIGAGLSAGRTLRHIGHGALPDKADDDPTPGFPFEQIAAEINGKPDAKYVSAVVPLAAGTGKADGKSGRGDWMMLDEWQVQARSQAEPRPHYDVALAVAVLGPEALERFPVAQFGSYLTVDRKEIESLRTIRQLVMNYVNGGRQTKPLSLGVFGPPGSGKSYIVLDIAKAVGIQRKDVKVFNLSQFKDPADLFGAFHQVRDMVLKGTTPLIFWDEFDAQGYRWLQYLLAPMEDGEFQDGQVTHPIGKCIFVFAGATSATFDKFGPVNPDQLTHEDLEALGREPIRLQEVEKAWRDFVLAKGPDFKSRLMGYLNILGVNKKVVCEEKAGRRVWREDEGDLYFPIRRALFMRSLFKVRDKERLELDEQIIKALLEMPRFKGGGRSLDFLCKHIRGGSGKPGRSSLPGSELLDMHVDAELFWELCERDMDFLPHAETLAFHLHEAYRLRIKGRADKKERDVPFDKLPPDMQASNIAQALRIPGILRLANMHLEKGPVVPLSKLIPDRKKRGAAEAPIRKALESDNLLELLAEAEHNGWMVERMLSGWRYGRERDDGKKIHDCLIPYSQLTEEIKDYDRLTIIGKEAPAGQPHLEQFGYVDIVKMIGLRVVMDDKASRKGAAS
jgi:hypothetical protein